jgi:hypothetical protein
LIQFVLAVSRSGLEAIDSLLDPTFSERATDDALLNAALLAASARQVDLSRGTWEELVASGRIALLKEPAVRLALAHYARFVGDAGRQNEDGLRVVPLRIDGLPHRRKSKGA